MEAEMKACDPVLLGILSHKLDLYNSWSCQLERDEEQDRQLKQYECHSLAMETTDVRGDSAEYGIRPGIVMPPAKVKVALAATTKTTIKCSYCMYSHHKLYTCPKFKLQCTKDRVSFVKHNNLYTTCLNAHPGKSHLS